MVGLQPLMSTFYIIFAQLLDSEGTYMHGSIGITYLNITLALHIFFLESQSCLGEELRETSPNGYDLRPPLAGWTTEFDYYQVAYKYNIQDIVALPRVSHI